MFSPEMWPVRWPKPIAVANKPTFPWRCAMALFEWGLRWMMWWCHLGLICWVGWKWDLPKSLPVFTILVTYRYLSMIDFLPYCGTNGIRSQGRQTWAKDACWPRCATVSAGNKDPTYHRAPVLRVLGSCMTLKYTISLRSTPQVLTISEGKLQFHTAGYFNYFLSTSFNHVQKTRIIQSSRDFGYRLSPHSLRPASFPRVGVAWGCMASCSVHMRLHHGTTQALSTGDWNVSYMG